MIAWRKPIVVNLRWPRWTTRRLMLAVVVVGLLMGWVNLARRRERFQTLAVKHEVLLYFAIHGHHHGGPNPERAGYHESMRLKYLRAADRPWLMVEPDEPAP
jgi:hypothetical protein